MAAAGGAAATTAGGAGAATEAAAAVAAARYATPTATDVVFGPATGESGEVQNRGARGSRSVRLPARLWPSVAALHDPAHDRGNTPARGSVQRDPAARLSDAVVELDQHVARVSDLDRPAAIRVALRRDQRDRVGEARVGRDAPARRSGRGRAGRRGATTTGTRRVNAGAPSKRELRAELAVMLGSAPVDDGRACARAGTPVRAGAPR